MPAKRQASAAPGPERSPKAKAKAKAEPKPQDSDVMMELKDGERDSNNLAFVERVMADWDAVRGHKIFENVVDALPTTLKDGGTQAPFSQREFETIMGRDPDSNPNYLCAANLSWIAWTWTATPGIPARLAAVKELCKTVYAKPCSLDSLIIAIPDPTYKPLQHRGDLRRVSPEEITAAYLFAIKRDIDNHESDEVLLQWRHHMLSTTCKFVLLQTQMSRYWFCPCAA